MGKISGKPGPDPRPPAQREMVRGFGEGGASGKPLEKLAEKEAKKQKDWMKTHRA